MDMVMFSIGGAERERIEVKVLCYERVPTGDYPDDNWLKVLVSVSAGAFSGSYGAAFRTEELVRFRDELESLYRSLHGEAKFTTLEGQLFLHLTGNGRGEINLRGTAVDAVGTGNQLEFELSLDQTDIQRTLNELCHVIGTFSVRSG